MNFARFLYKNEEYLGVYKDYSDKILPLNQVLVESFKTLIEFIAQSNTEDLKKLEVALERGQEQESYLNFSEVRFLSPIDKPVHDIICVGVNYAEHLKESKRALKENSLEQVQKSVYFSKRVNHIMGSEDRIKGQFDVDEEMDYEVELAVIIGKAGRNITKEEAENYIFGYNIFNDLSSRKIQRERGQWYLGKSMDQYCSMGPSIVYKSAVPFPVEVNIKSYVNAELRQNSNTKMMLNDIPGIIADLSSYIELEPGDIIATGTPSGVGMGFSPPRYLKKGDIVSCQIEQLGELKNIID